MRSPTSCINPGALEHTARTARAWAMASRSAASGSRSKARLTASTSRASVIGARTDNGVAKSSGDASKARPVARVITASIRALRASVSSSSADTTRAAHPCIPAVPPSRRCARPQSTQCRHQSGVERHRLQMQRRNAVPPPPIDQGGAGAADAKADHPEQHQGAKQHIQGFLAFVAVGPGSIRWPHHVAADATGNQGRPHQHGGIKPSNSRAEDPVSTWAENPARAITALAPTPKRRERCSIRRASAGVVMPSRSGVGGPASAPSPAGHDRGRRHSALACRECVPAAPATNRSWGASAGTWPLVPR